MRSRFRPAEWVAEGLAALGAEVRIVREGPIYWVVAQKESTPQA